MAYVSQEKKQRIAQALKAVVPRDWKYSLAVRDHCEVVMTIYSAPINLLAGIKPSEYYNPQTATHADINVYHCRREFADEALGAVFERIIAALNTDNHDNSDPMTDYVDVGHYVSVRIGTWERPFVVSEPQGTRRTSSQRARVAPEPASQRAAQARVAHDLEGDVEPNGESDETPYEVPR